MTKVTQKVFNCLRILHLEVIHYSTLILHNIMLDMVPRNQCQQTTMGKVMANRKRRK